MAFELYFYEGIKMKTILCFGDSNTWGYNPVSSGRYPRDKRWTGVLRNELGNEYEIIEEGLNGRTTVWEDPIEGDKNGKRQLPLCLESHKPLDLVILMLGTNDLKKRFSVSAFDIANSVGVLVDIVKKSMTGINSSSPKVLLIAPPPTAKLTDFAEMFEGADEKSKKFSEYYKRVAKEHDCEFFDASEIIVSSNLDGIHFEEIEHHKLGKAVANIVKKLL